MTRTAAKPARQASNTPASGSATVGYDADFFVWTQEQARLVREKRFSEIDIENVAEELESVGKSDKREISSRLTVLIGHLLKWRHQPSERSSRWRGTIREQRERIDRVIADSPSLRSYPASSYKKDYLGARLLASEETGVDFDSFPEACPFTIEQILDPDFLPDAAAA